MFVFCCCRSCRSLTALCSRMERAGSGPAVEGDEGASMATPTSHTTPTAQPARHTHPLIQRITPTPPPTPWSHQCVHFGASVFAPKYSLRRRVYTRVHFDAECTQVFTIPQCSHHVSTVSRTSWPATHALKIWKRNKTTLRDTAQPVEENKKNTFPTYTLLSNTKTRNKNRAITM